MQEQESGAAAAAASEGAPAPPPPRKTKKPKKRKAQDTKSEDGGGGNAAGGGGTGGGGGGTTTAGTASAAGGGTGRVKKPRSKGVRGGGAGGGGGARNSSSNSAAADAAAAAAAQQAALNAAQQAVNEQMLRALEEDQYSAAGSIVDTESDEEDEYTYRGKPLRLDRSAIQQAIKKMAHLERMGAAAAAAASSSGVASGGGTSAANNIASSGDGDNEQEEGISGGGGGRGGINKKKQQKKKDDHSASGISAALMDDDVGMTGVSSKLADDFSDAEEDLDRDGGSIFGATTGSSNSTWVECDKCKKWRRLRGVVDEKKLPTKWYCSMNRNDPERARCSAPEEEYDTLQTPESAADSKARKHLRVWVRRLQCNEAYEARQPTLTRGKKRATASSSKDPYEWVRCCNPSCGKWRAVLRIMDAKSNVIDRTKDGEWYCVMNTWDEKTASCAAPQENLPAVGCPPWIMQDEE